MAGSVGILELNDYELRLSFAGQTHLSSGFATLTVQSVIFGEQARQQSRIQPLSSFDKYWNQLGLDSIQHGNDRFRHYADFAYHQLLQLHQQVPDCKEMVLVVPASFNRNQLALLLGICDKLPFQVKGIVDSAIVSVADKVGQGHYLHLDMQLHQCLLTEIEVNQNIQIKSADIIAGTGLISLFQHWAKYLTNQFVQQCRFDPMHDAKSEQALYDLLPQLLNTRNNGNEEVQLSLDGKQVKLNRQSLARHTQGLFVPVLKAVSALGKNDCLLITNRIVAVPELFSQLENTFTLDHDALVNNTLKHIDNICRDPGQVGFVTTLPASQRDSDPALLNKQHRSTHILWQNAAYPIGSKPIYITAMPELNCSTSNSDQAQFVLKPQANALTLSMLNGSSARVNGKPGREGEALALGDVLSFGPQQSSLTLISVLEDESW